MTFVDAIMQERFAKVQKYGGSVPRYTSYPPVPEWTGAPSEGVWMSHIRQTLDDRNGEGISLYVHLPFCEQLCTYCACNKRITVNHAVESPYIEDLRREWARYRGYLPKPCPITELHLGGGTPTFFSAKNLDVLMQMLLEDTVLTPGASLSVEVHPNYTSREQLAVLYRHGFRRISIGVQSLDLDVQKLINRVQPLAHVARVVNDARELGYTSVNVDLLYGLPKQSAEVMQRDAECILQLRPDRIAHYGYAHVPWKHAGQRRYTEADLPSSEERFASAELARRAFTSAGYVEIGFDHYALPDDALAQAAENGTLHRNFMGYTDQRTPVMLGLGVSSISESPMGYVQNEKHLETYRQRLADGETLWVAGHVFSEADRTMRQHILDLMCRLQTSLPETLNEEGHSLLASLAADGAITIEQSSVKVHPSHRSLLRSACAAFDPAQTSAQTTPRYSSNL